MTKPLNISRRDFLNGAALSLAAGTTLTPMEILAATQRAADYPPSLTGMRGSHTGSFEVAHSVAWGGTRYPTPKRQTDKTYDLVIVGGGISGLSSALLYQQRAGRDLSILLLDNHDDFGGHAKRNEFTVDGKRLIGYGGSQSLEAPSSYSKIAKAVLRDVSIDTQRFYDYYDRDYFGSRKLERGFHFPKATYGRDVLVPNVFGSYLGHTSLEKVQEIVASFPISEGAKAAAQRLFLSKKDYLAGKSREEKIALLQRISYADFLQQYADIPAEVTDIFRDLPRSIWGVGWESCSALESYRWGNPGFGHMGLGQLGGHGSEEEEPYIFHFPDGNAGVARSLVRKLIPEALTGDTMEDIVSARADYGMLDRASSKVRLRLNSSAVNIQHTTDQKAVDVTYVTGSEVHRVRGRHVIYAGYHNMLPHICPELPADQQHAIASVSKVPLVGINVALRHWSAFSELGYHSVSVAQPELMHSFGMDFPVSMGGYQYASNPNEPVIVHGWYVPAMPGSGLNSIAQHKAGQRKLYEMNYAEFEQKIVAQMDGALSSGGFDAERDIAGITVNRWPHGYAYEYNELFDDPSFGPEKGPHITARKQVGRISIGNSDSSAYAYVDGAIDAADRTVNEQLKIQDRR
jgi:spermidine dehydrogenase